MLKYFEYLHEYVIQCCLKHKHAHLRKDQSGLETSMKMKFEGGYIAVNQSNKESSGKRQPCEKREGKAQQFSKSKILENTISLLNDIEELKRISDADEDD